MAMDSFPLNHPDTRALTGGDLLAQSLKQMAVEVAFGLHGGHLDAFLMGCHDIGIRLVDTRHETVAVQAAQAYAVLRSKVGVCFVTANSGFSNGLPGLVTASKDRSPILCITSSVPQRDTLTNSLQGSVDQVVVAAPLTKLAHRVTHAEDIPRIVSHAVRTALTGPPGPVLLDFPIDVLFSPIHEKLISWGSIVSPLPYPPGPSSRAIDDAIDLIGSAQRPVIIAGTSVTREKAGKGLIDLSQRSGIPIFHSDKHLSAIPSSFKYFGGRASNLVLLSVLQKQQPDLVILLGVRTGMFLGGRSGAIIPVNCKLLQVDIDGTEIGRTLPINQGVISDVAEFTSALGLKLSDSGFPSIDTTWVKEVLSLQTLPQPWESEPPTQPSGLLHPYHALKQVFTATKPDTIVIIDGGEAGCWANGLAPLCKPHAILNATGYLGFLGSGFGFALGAAVACPDRRVLLIQGDGSAGFHLMELDTYKRLGLNITTVVVNNACWGMSRNGQDIIYGEGNPVRVTSSLSGEARYDGVGSALGAEGARVNEIEKIGPAVRRLMAMEGPGCLDLIVDAKPTHPFTAGSISLTDDPDVVVVPYYENVVRPHYNVK